MSILKERIKKIRKEANLSMEKFGKKIGITKSSVSMLESGRNAPSEQTIKLICFEFGINENWLRTGEGKMKAAQTTQERYNLNLKKLQPINDETIIRWVNAVAETNPEALKQIEEFMKKLLENQDEEN